MLVMRGLQANVGNPGRVMPHLTRPLVAVNTKEETLTHRTLVAYVCGPQSGGQSACMDVATRVALYWYSIGAECKWGEYSFDGKSAMHVVKVYATWPLKVEEE